MLRNSLRVVPIGGDTAVFFTMRFLVALGVLLSICFAKQCYSASLELVSDFGPNPGQLDMYVYVPDRSEQATALVVALHGCLQQASDIDDETGLKKYAAALKLILLFPQQRISNNGRLCFNWFASKHNRRHRGESGSLKNMILFALKEYGVDPAKVFVLGLSAGGSMTAVLLANYPEMFQGGAIIAGTPYNCNRPSLVTGAWWWWLKTWFGDAAAASFACGLFQQTPVVRSPEQWGSYVLSSTDGAPDRWPKISLWHGDADDIVNPANQIELLKQWTNVLGVDQIPDRTERGETFTRRVYFDAHNNPRLETYQIVGFEHAFAIDPGTGLEQCGTEGPYVKDGNICSSLAILKFWGIHPNF